MGQTVADTIREITRKHLEKGNLLFSQAVSAVGWIGNTVPDCKGIVELSMADVAGAGIAVGAALTGKRSIFVVRYQDFLFLNSSPLVNYAAKSKDIFGVGVPILIRALADEGSGLGPVHSACLHSIFMHMPGMRVCAPMTPGEYEEAWEVFLANDEPMFFSEHRRSFSRTTEMPDVVLDDADITIFAVSMARLNVLEAIETLKSEDIKCNVIHLMWLKPLILRPKGLFYMPFHSWGALMRSGRGLVVDSDFEITGASQSIAYELMLATELPVKAMGRQDRSTGAARHLEYGTPTPQEIVELVKDIVGGKEKEA